MNQGGIKINRAEKLIPHTLDDVADGPGLGVPFGPRCQPIGLEQSSLFSRSGIADAAVTGLGAGRRNDWQTPPEIFEALGCRFDMDVAAPVNGPLHVPTSRWLSSGSLENDWLGFIWMNPPFGGRNGIKPWLDKFLAHRNGIALTPDRVSAPWFQEAWDRPAAILFTPKTPFLLPNGEKAGNPAFGNALWACGERAVEAVLRSEARGFGKVKLTHDAKEKATTGKPGGNEAASDDRLDTHHSGTLSSTFPLDRGV